MSVIVANLERAGAALRRPQEEHGRIQIVEITERAELLARRKLAAKSAEEALLARVSQTEGSVVCRCFFQIAKNLKASG